MTARSWCVHSFQFLKFQRQIPLPRPTVHFLWLKLFSSGKESNKVTKSLPSPLLFALAVRAGFHCSHSWGPCAPVLVKRIHSAHLRLPGPRLDTATETQPSKKSLQVDGTLGSFLDLKKFTQLTRKVGDKDRVSYILPPIFYYS